MCARDHGNERSLSKFPPAEGLAVLRRVFWPDHALLEDGIGCVVRQDFAVHHESALRERAVPDFVIALPCLSKWQAAGTTNDRAYLGSQRFRVLSSTTDAAGCTGASGSFNATRRPLASCSSFNPEQGNCETRRSCTQVAIQRRQWKLEALRKLKIGSIVDR
jgi:hypothetical protein